MKLGLQYQRIHICKRCINEENDKMRDHDHLTGKFVGVTHNKCELKRNNKTYKIPVIFHKLKGMMRIL